MHTHVMTMGLKPIASNARRVGRELIIKTIKFWGSCFTTATAEEKKKKMMVKK